MNRTYTVVLTTVLVVLAGCSGGVPGGTATDGPTAGTTTGPGGTTGSTGATGTVNFYVSDEPNAIDDFEHLNVTITKVGFHEAGEEGESSESNETATTTGTETAETTATDTETAETTETATATDTETPETTETATATGTETPEGTDTATESPEETERDGDDDDGEGGEDWHEFDVDSKTVDLTELQGNNATLVGQFELDNGTYDKVFVYISDVNGTLKNGEQVNVKLPSERLHINKRFTVGANESVDFVYDITVFKAGKSGKYILKPVVSESGTDVEIEPTDENGTDGEDADDGGDLEARFVGTVEPGESATVKVTRKGEPVENATVTVNGTEYRTTADGTVTFDVPENAEELEVTVEYEGDEVELERTFDDSGGGEDGGQQDGERPTSTPTPTATSTPTSTPN